MTTVSAIVTDIEGTTSSISFVHDVLFPWARQALPAWLRRHQERADVAALITAAAAEAGCPVDDLDAVIAALQQWIDEDRKLTCLKSLQGLIWADGYAEGAFRSHVYPDAVAALRRWHAAGLPIHVYSSGSIGAQKLLFAHTEAGDLSGCFSGHFDTTTGPKREAASYAAIAAALGIDPAALLFLSDVGAELDAAAASGWQTVWLVRPGNHDRPGDQRRHPVAADFDAVSVLKSLP